MKIIWSIEARDDVDRLINFVHAFDPLLASEIEQLLEQAPRRLLEFPRRGSRLSEFDPQEVREFRLGNYLLRYELAKSGILVLRYFHTRENRF